MDLGKWTVVAGARGELTLSNRERAIALCGCLPVVVADDKEIRPDGAWEFALQQSGASATARYRLPGQWKIDLALSALGQEGWLSVRAKATNESGQPAAVQTIAPLETQTVDSAPAFDRVWTHGVSMCDFASMHSLGAAHTSQSCAGLTNRAGDNALVAGFLDLRRAFVRIDIESDAGRTGRLRAVCEREGIALAPGQTIELPELALGAGPGLAALMDTYAAMSGRRAGARPSKPMTGWCSWYYYYGTETEEDILANIKALAESPFKEALRVIQIDDGWNKPQPDSPRAWGDWLPGAKFPNGMRAVADEIKGAGFMAGLWVAPFACDAGTDLYKTHPEWLIQGPDGRPTAEHGIYALDLTHPGAQGFIRDTFRRVFDEWGFDYIKIDFLVFAIRKGRRFDNSLTTAELFDKGMQIIREVAGERYILNCGSPFGPAIGHCDAMRIGFDVSSRWQIPTDPSRFPSGNLNVRAAAIQTIWHQWMHDHWWANDADCLVTRDYGSEGEKDQFVLAFEGRFVTDPPYGLSDEEAAFWVRLVWMTGGMALVSENMTELTGPRRDLLLRAFPPNPQPTRWLDWYENIEAPVLISKGERTMIGQFNLGNVPARSAIPAAKAGLRGSWTFREWLTGETISGRGETMEFPEVPPHGARIWVLAGD